MPIEENKAIVHRAIEEMWNKGNMAVADEVWATNCVRHDPTLPEPIRGLEAFKQWVTGTRIAFPDIHVTIEDMVAEGEKVAVRYTFRGTHKGELMGIPPTGKQVTVTGIGIFRSAEGKFQEGWDSFDALGMLQQLGVVPPPGQPGG